MCKGLKTSLTRADFVLKYKILSGSVILESQNLRVEP